jgi:peptidoglycan-associated lipoprotein
MRLKVTDFKIIVFLLTLILGSGCSIKSRIETADQRFEAGEYQVASELYGRVYGKVPSADRPLKARMAFQQAECFRLLNNNRADVVYQRAVRLNYADSVVYLRLARELHRNGKYAEAQRNYQLYLEYDSACVLALNGLNAIEQIPVWRAQPTRHALRREPHFFRRNFSFYSPSFQGNETDVLYYTSNVAVSKNTDLNKVHGRTNALIYSIRRDAAGNWSKPENVFSEDFSKNNDIGVCAFTSDGRSMYFTRAPQNADTKANVEILHSSRAGGEWTDPKPLSIFRDSSITVAHPSISADGQTFYFVSDAPGGQGGKDIWRGRLEGSEVKFIENLGPSVNTPGDEMFPVMRGDSVLYFASDGLPGFGGLDLFRAVEGDDGWTVTNLGVPINSNYDDFGIIFKGNLEAGYFSSNRGERRGNESIYYFELPAMEVVVEGVITDDRNVPIPDAMVRLISNTGQNTKVRVRRDGSYRIVIDKDMECAMLATARGFLNKSHLFSTSGVTDSKVFKVNMSLPAVFRPVQLDNIFFEFAKWNLTPDSEAGLQELLGVLNDNPNTLIEISAHTDYIGKDEDNQVLSQKRAQSVVDYLINAGIDKDRLITTGYGEEKPVVTDEALVEKYPFLAVETALTEEYIRTLEPAEQQVANQINRRTEFRVVRMNYK